jgi:WD repeat-containing protein 22
MKENLVLRLHKERLGDRGGHRKVFLENRWSNSNKFYSYDLVSHYGCVNAVEFSHDGGWLVSGGDDRRVLLWNLEEALEGRGHVRCMAAEHKSNIFCLDTDHALTKIYSGGNDEQVIVHDTQTSELVDCFQHEEPVNGLSVHPVQSDLFLTACSDGRLLMYDMRQPATSEAIMIAGCSYAYHSVQFNPVEHRLLVGANQKFGIGLYDIRKPRSTVLSYHSRSSMHARFNSSGTQIVGLRKRLPPVIFNIHDPIPACEFDTPQYYNSCTMKSCCFGGPGDQYVFSGSDDFNLYAWKIPDDMKTTWVNRAHAVFKGHRSIVNQVRYNPHTQLLASSGVEKIIKLWSDWPFTQAESADSGSKARKV